MDDIEWVISPNQFRPVFAKLFHSIHEGSFQLHVRAGKIGVQFKVNDGEWSPEMGSVCPREK